MALPRAQTAASGKYKVVLIGASSSGKSALMQYYTKGRFPQFSEPTIGASFGVSPQQGKLEKTELWDTAGNERYEGLLPMYLQQATGVIICVDSSQSADVSALQDLCKKVKRYTAGSQLVIAFTKQDLKNVLSESSNDEEPIEIHAKVAEALDVPFDAISVAYVSAKTGMGVKELFSGLISRMASDSKKASLKSTASSAPVIYADTNSMLAALTKYADDSWSFKHHRKRAKVMCLVLDWALRNQQIDFARFIVEKQKHWLTDYDDSPVTDSKWLQLPLPDAGKNRELYEHYLFSPSKNKNNQKKSAENKSDFFKVLCDVGMRLENLKL